MKAVLTTSISRSGKVSCSRCWSMRDGAPPWPYGKPCADDSPWKKTRKAPGVLLARKKSSSGVGTKGPRNQRRATSGFVVSQSGWVAWRTNSG